MKIEPLPINAETTALARRLIWFEPAELALAEPVRFLAYAFAAARAADMAILRRYVDTKSLRYALQHAPPGIIDARSWAYWHLMLDIGAAPALPCRNLCTKSGTVADAKEPEHATHAMRARGLSRPSVP